VKEERLRRKKAYYAWAATLTPEQHRLYAERWWSRLVEEYHFIHGRKTARLASQSRSASGQLSCAAKPESIKAKEVAS
jgi:hypothetical protein